MSPLSRRSLLGEDEYVDPDLSALGRAKFALAGAIRPLWWSLRQTVASRERSGSHSAIVPLSTEEAEQLLARNDFEPGWWLSYSFRKEVINMRRPVYDSSPHADWWQAHIRGYKVRDDDPRIADTDYDATAFTDLTCHIEPEPKEHPDIHVKYVSYNKGTKLLLQLLGQHGIPYQFIPEHEQRHPKPRPLKEGAKDRAGGIRGTLRNAAPIRELF